MCVGSYRCQCGRRLITKTRLIFVEGEVVHKHSKQECGPVGQRAQIAEQLKQ